MKKGFVRMGVLLLLLGLVVMVPGYSARAEDLYIPVAEKATVEFEGDTVEDELSTFVEEEPTEEDFEARIEEELEGANALDAENTFTIDANGGAFNDGTSIKEVSTSYSYLMNDAQIPTRTGYAFNGWYSEPSCKTLFDSNSIPGKIPGVGSTIYAGWTDQYYVVAYDENGGYQLVKDEDLKELVRVYSWYVKVPKGKALNEANSPQDRENHVFSGVSGSWGTDNVDRTRGLYYFDREATKRVPVDYIPTGDITLYVGWNTVYTVTFNMYPGSYYGNTITTKTINPTYGSTLSGYNALPKPELIYDGQQVEFLGWYLDKEKTQPISETEISSMSFTGSTTFYAKYAEERPASFKVTFNAGEGTINGNHTYVAEVKGNTEYGENGSVPVPEDLADGRTFRGWYEYPYPQYTERLTTEKIMNRLITSDVTLYARYSGDDSSAYYTVTFHPEPGTMEDEYVKIRVKALSPISSTPSFYLPIPPEGDTFVAWCTDAALRIPVSYSMLPNIIVKSDMDFYAKYRKTSPSPNPSDEPTAEEMLAVKQKFDVTTVFENSYKKYQIEKIDSGAGASVSSTGIVTASRPGDVKVFGMIKSGTKWIKGSEWILLTIFKPKFLSSTVYLPYPGAVYDPYENIDVSMDTFANPDDWELTTNSKVATLTKKMSVDGMSIEDPLVTATKAGSVKVTAVYGSGKNAVRYAYTIKVGTPKISSKKISLQTGATAKLSFTLTMPDSFSGDENDFQWYLEGNSSTNIDDDDVLDSIISLDDSNITNKKNSVVVYDVVIRGLSAGTQKVCIKAGNTVYACDVTVPAPTLSKKSINIKMNGNPVRLKLGKTKLVADEISWVSDDEEIAEVDENGFVIPVSPGTTWIYTTAGGCTDKCLVTVKAK